VLFGLKSTALPTRFCDAAGATGGVGQRVVQQLLAQGRVVRALVRDVDKAKQLLVSCVWALCVGVVLLVP
jgi:NAD(P)-dependent dehydrogenase (short-subunit alcohol dehydrogenase family)